MFVLNVIWCGSTKMEKKRIEIEKRNIRKGQSLVFSFTCSPEDLMPTLPSLFCCIFLGIRISCCTSSRWTYYYEISGYTSCDFRAQLICESWGDCWLCYDHLCLCQWWCMTEYSRLFSFMENSNLSNGLT